MKYCFNKTGASMLGIMTYAAVGLFIIAGMTRTMMYFSESTQKIYSKTKFDSIVENTKMLILNTKVWASSRRYCETDIDGNVDYDHDNDGAWDHTCYPGFNHSYGEPCPYTLWYNPADPLTLSNYQIKPNIQRWICSYQEAGYHSYGIGFLTLEGEPIFLTVNECLKDPGGENDPEALALGNGIITDKKYIRVKIEGTDEDASNPMRMPNFTVTIEDPFGSHRRTSFQLFADTQRDLGFRQILSELTPNSGDAQRFSRRKFMHDSFCYIATIDFDDPGSPHADSHVYMSSGEWLYSNSDNAGYNDGFICITFE